MNIALKEANETKYWTNLLHDSDFFDNNIFKSLASDIEEIICLLAAIVKTSKGS